MASEFIFVLYHDQKKASTFSSPSLMTRGAVGNLATHVDDQLVPLFYPRTQRWDEHFAVEEDPS